MRRQLVIASVVAALAATAGCGSDDTSLSADSDRARILAGQQESLGGNTSQQNVSQSAGQARTGPLSESDLRSALLSDNDLPGFSNGVPISETRKDNYDGCPALRAALKAKDAFPAYAEANLSKGGLGPFVGEGIVSGTEQQARSSLMEFNSLMTRCRAFTSKDVMGPTSHQLSALSMPKYGDETRALRMTTKAQDATAVTHVVIIRRGGEVIVVTNTALNGTPDVAVTKTAAQKALANLQAHA